MAWVPPPLIKNLGYAYDKGCTTTVCSPSLTLLNTIAKKLILYIFCHIFHSKLNRYRKVWRPSCRLLGSQNNFHWQLGGQINHQPCSRKAARVMNAQSWTALFRAFSSYRQPSASLNKGVPQLDKPLGRTGHTLMACTVAEAIKGINLKNKPRE